MKRIHKKKLRITFVIILFCVLYMRSGFPDKQVINYMNLPRTESQSTGTGDPDVLSDPESFFVNTFYGVDERLENVKFSSKNTVEKLKMIYDGIDFYDGFREGDLSIYDYYAEKYSQLLKGEVRYYDPKDETYNDIYIYTPEYLMENPDSPECFLYDMDEDGKPELCLTDVRGGYVFKYIPESDQCVLWLEAGGPNLWFMGSRKISQFGLSTGRYYFTQLSKSAEEEFTVEFYEYSTKGPTIYLVSLPLYKNGFHEDDIIEEMRNDGYYEEELSYESAPRNCFFRVTEKEYHEVTKSYLEARQQAFEEGETFVFEPWRDW